ncbi:WXG100-like domain-containing protein [Nocardioides lacusdianchii]|uniref:WXG100-like domain-containing protein n=1 Tax=Nocardioides lacusdianchii TaxID=2783664 RepID=UPI001CCEEC15|nr:hypothetical protein [Nocardioides lacusdianchii]
MRLEVDSGGYDSAAEALDGGNHVLAGGYTTLTGKLGSYSAMAGDDISSEDFVKNYDSAAAEAVAAFSELTTAYGNLAVLTATSGANHREANRRSVYKKGGGPAGDDKAPQPEIVSIYTPPSSLGGDNADVPEFWNLIVDHLQGWAWPSADTGKLREAASTWRSAAGTIDRAPSYASVASSQLGRQRSPEVAFATSALRELRTNSTDLAEQCRELATACDDYAEQVDKTRETIKDLVRDLAIEIGATAVISGIASFVTFGGAAVVGGGVATARAISCARRIITVLAALKAVRAIAVMACTLPKLQRIRHALRKYQTARAVRHASRAAGAGPRTLWTSWAQYPKVQHAGREYALVGDRLYARHAVDRLQPSGLGAPAGATGAGRSISPRFIDHLLDTVKPSTVTTPQGAIRQIYESGGVRIVTEDDIVITVITRTN